MLLTSDFDLLAEMQFSEDKEELANISVGWGKKETQFHGKEGKQAALAPEAKPSGKLLEGDAGKSEISWRADGKFFACLVVDSQGIL